MASINELHGCLDATLDHDLIEILDAAKQFSKVTAITNLMLRNFEEMSETERVSFPQNEFRRVNELAQSIATQLNAAADQVAKGIDTSRNLFTKSEANLDVLVKLLPEISSWLACQNNQAEPSPKLKNDRIIIEHSC